MKMRFIISLLLGLLVSAVTLYLAFRNVSFGEVSRSILKLNPLWILPAVVTLMASMIVRVIRWRLILRAKHDVSFAGAYHPLIIGFTLNCILPARTGEIARPVILRQKEEVPFPTGLASVASERFFDILILVSFFAVMFHSVDIDPDLNIAFGKYQLNRDLLITIGNGMVKLGVFIICMMILIASQRIRNAIAAGLLSLPGFFIRKNMSLKNRIEKKYAPR